MATAADVGLDEWEHRGWRKDTPENRSTILAYVRSLAADVDGLWEVCGRARSMPDAIRDCMAEISADFALLVAVAATVESETGLAFGS